MLVNVECVNRLVHIAFGGSCRSRSELLGWHGTKFLHKLNRDRIIKITSGLSSGPTDS